MGNGWKPRVLFAAMISIAVLAVGCGGSSDDGPVDEESLDGRSFISKEVTGHELVAGTEVSISFSGDSVNAVAGCNAMFGKFQLDGDRMTVPMLGSTKVGCDPARLKQDRWLSDFLSGGATVSLDGEELTLTEDDVELVFHEPIAGDSSLIGVTWELETVIDPEGVATNVPGGKKQATLEFSNGGTIAYGSGCNGGSGKVKVGDGTIVFEMVSWTEMLCQGPVMKVERAMEKVMQGEVDSEIEVSELSLSRKGTTLVFRAR